MPIIQQLQIKFACCHPQQILHCVQNDIKKRSPHSAAGLRQHASQDKVSGVLSEGSSFGVLRKSVSGPHSSENSNLTSENNLIYNHIVY